MSRPISERTLRSYYDHAAVEGRDAIRFALLCEERARQARRNLRPRSEILEATRLARAARKAVQEARRRNLQGPSEDARNASEGLVSAVSAGAILPARLANSQGSAGPASLGVA